MSNLTLGLVVIGALLLAGVVLHGLWSLRRNAPRQPQSEGAPPREPGFEPGEGAPDGAGPRESRELHLDGDLGGGLIPQPQPERRPGLDALLDVLAPIALDGPAGSSVSGEAALAALPPTRRAGSKPFAIEGLNAHSGQWETPAPGQRYGAFQAGVQLANRTGALNEIEYSEFAVKTRAFADAIGGEPEFPEMLEEVARARELDQFAVDHDAQLGFALRARSAAWSPGYVQQNAARQGFAPGTIPGRMVLPAVTPGLPPVLGLAFDTQAALAEDPAQTAVREITLSLDVPQVPRDERPFARMCEVIEALATAMDGVVTDADGQPLPPQAQESIGTDLERLYDILDARDLAAGSVLARRLFS